MEENPIVKDQPVQTQTTSAIVKPSETQHQYPKAVVVFLFFVFPPMAWFILVIDNTYHTWFPKVLALSGVISLIILATSYLSIGTQISQLYDALGVEYTNAGLVQLSIYASIGVALTEILFAVIVYQYLKKHNTLSGPMLTCIILLLVAGSVIGFLPMLLTISSLYPALNSLYQGTY